MNPLELANLLDEARAYTATDAALTERLTDAIRELRIAAHEPPTTKSRATEWQKEVIRGGFLDKFFKALGLTLKEPPQ